LAGVLAAARPSGAASPKANDPVDRAIAGGVKYLLARQEPDGSLYDPEKGNPGLHASALTGLGVLAMAASGHLPSDKTPEGTGIRRSVNFLLQPDRQDADGYFGRADNSNMYGHGIVSLALAEMLGMGFDKAQDRLLRDRVRKAVDLILRAQLIRKREPRHEGGWRYKPDSADSDLSLSVWQLMVLRSAKNAGLEIPAQAIERAVAYLRQSFSTTGGRRGGTGLGGFSYQVGQTPDFSMTSAGMLAMVLAGQYDAPEVTAAANYLLANPPTPENRWYFYGLYYYAQAMFQRGGEYATEARRLTETLLLSQQLQDGSWQGLQGQEYGTGKIYSTSLAILSLAVKFHYLPIYQR
jgi:squalene cyclase